MAPKINMAESDVEDKFLIRNQITIRKHIRT